MRQGLYSPACYFTAISLQNVSVTSLCLMVSVAIFNFWIANMNNVSWTNFVNYLGVVVTVYGLADAVGCFCSFLFYTRA